MSPAAARRIIKLAAQGFTADQIARSCGLTTGLVRSYLETDEARESVTETSSAHVDDVLSENEVHSRARASALRLLAANLPDAGVSELIRAVDVLHRIPAASPMPRAENEQKSLTLSIQIPHTVRQQIASDLGVNEHGQIANFAGQELEAISPQGFEQLVQAEKERARQDATARATQRPVADDDF